MFILFKFSVVANTMLHSFSVTDVALIAHVTNRHLELFPKWFDPITSPKYNMTDYISLFFTEWAIKIILDTNMHQNNVCC